MLKKTVPYFHIPFVLILIGLGTLTAFWSRNDASEMQQQFAEKVNLALRQTAHQMLKLAGDSISTIPPVKKTGNNTYSIQLENHFLYDSLPILLQKSFTIYGIKSSYNVAVSACKNEELVLGYSSFNIFTSVGVLKSDSVPCVGRNQAEGCYNFAVTLADMPSNASNVANMWLVLGGLGVFLIGFRTYYTYFLPFKKDSTPSVKTDKFEEKEFSQVDETHLIFIGQSIFDTRHQTVSICDDQQKLTFREAKLLELFCHHKNELLERDFILKQIWEDEGVLVGRSVDVFVSRLRKILKNDASLKITNVHSRGYRFEILET